jgi:hypothetical protein
MTRRGLASDRLGWPTVMAIRDGDLLGFLATQKRDDAVVAGPLVIDEDTAPLIIMRLVEAYDKIMELAGIQVYLFYLEADRPRWVQIVDKIAKDAGDALKLLQVDDAGNRWYERRLSYGRLESQPATANAG